MTLKKLNKFKPFYKKFVNLKENVQNRKKIFNFKKQKWAKFIKYYKKKLSWYRKFKLLNPNKCVVSKYPNRHTSYLKRFKTNLRYYKIFNIFYGGLRKKALKKKLQKIKKRNIVNFYFNFLAIFEKRLDIILYRANFFSSIRSAQQYIVHGNVSVNNKIIKKKSFILKTGDLISVNLKLHDIIYQNFLLTEFWPIPPKHLIINYKTLQVILGEMKNQNLSTLFLTDINLEKILTSLPKS